MDDYSRGYVFCDLILVPDLRTTIRALIAVMRQWQVIPKAVVFDNGSHFKGKLLSVFCERVGIRLIHSAVNHPQTNGKLERAFRDDMRDFYRRYAGWFFEPLHRDLPDYVHYRNYIRGHQALDGRPAIDRLNEPHTRAAAPEVLAGLESLACYEIGRKLIPASGRIRQFNRDAHVGPAFANREVTMFESLAGLEVRTDDQCAVLKDYRTYRQKLYYRWREIPPVLFFEPYRPAPSPRIAVACRL